MAAMIRTDFYQQNKHDETDENTTKGAQNGCAVLLNLRVGDSLVASYINILGRGVVDFPHDERSNTQVDQKMHVEEVCEYDNEKLFASNGSYKAADDISVSFATKGG